MAEWFDGIGVPLSQVYDDLPSVTPIATEFLIESASGGSCVIRVVVSSAYGSGADWQNEFFAEMVAGWVEILDNLAADFIKATRSDETTAHATLSEPGVQASPPSTRRLVRSGALAGAIAAVCTTVAAAIASAAGVSLEIDATAIPIPVRMVDLVGAGWASCWPDSFASGDGSSSSPHLPPACPSSQRSQLPTTPPPKPFSWGSTYSRQPSSSRLSAASSRGQQRPLTERRLLPPRVDKQDCQIPMISRRCSRRSRHALTGAANGLPGLNTPSTVATVKTPRRNVSAPRAIGRADRSDGTADRPVPAALNNDSGNRWA